MASIVNTPTERRWSYILPRAALFVLGVVVLDQPSGVSGGDAAPAARALSDQASWATGDDHADAAAPDEMVRVRSATVRFLVPPLLRARFVPTELVVSGLRLADATRGLTIAGNGSFHGKPIPITASGGRTVRLALGRADCTIDLIARGGEMLKSAATLGGGDVLHGAKIALSGASSRRAARSAPTT